jgi:hypothetical protein
MFIYIPKLQDAEIQVGVSSRYEERTTRDILQDEILDFHENLTTFFSIEMLKSCTQSHEDWSGDLNKLSICSALVNIDRMYAKTCKRRGDKSKPIRR